MNRATCQNCGAAIHEASGETTWYECKTMEWYVHSERAERISEECYKRQLAQKAAEFNEVVDALRNLVNDSQHKDHDCGDTPEHCPVLAARELVKKYGKR